MLEATRKGPTAQLPAPDCSTTSRIKGQRLQRAAGPPCSARNGPPDRAIGDYTEVGIEETRLVDNGAGIDKAIAAGVPAVTDNRFAICEADGVNVLLEVTGTVDRHPGSRPWVAGRGDRCLIGPLPRSRARCEILIPGGAHAAI